MIAGLRGAAVLVELLGTDLTAATAIGHHADAQRAQQRRGGAGALGRTLALCGLGGGQRLGRASVSHNDRIT